MAKDFRNIRVRSHVIIIIFLLLIFLQFISFGQMVNLQFSNPINDRDFNNKNSTCIAQDSTGFIWIGTNDGLYCYYGNKLIEYRSDPTDSMSLSGNGVRKLFVDDKGKLWIITHLGLCTYNSCFNNFEHIIGSVLPENEYLEISSVNQDNDNNIYFSGNSTIYIFDADSKTFTSFFELDSITISDFVFDDENNLWISSIDEGGLFFYNPKENRTESFFYDKENDNSLSSNIIQDIVYEGNSRLWIGTYGGGMNLLNTETRIFKRYNSADSYSNYISYTYLDKQNNLWICDMDGLKWYDRGNDKFNNYENLAANTNEVEDNPIGIIQDRHGAYWTIYSPGGVGYWFEPKGIRIYNDDPSNFYHTVNNNISVIEFDKNGALWIGNGHDGIDVFDWESNKHKSYLSDQNNPYSLGKGGVFSVYKDRRDRMWIGTNLGGLQYYDEANDRFISYVNDPRNPNSISNNDIRGIVENEDGNYWVITYGKGIDFLNTKEQKFYHYTSENSNLSNNWVFQLFMDSGENLWVASAWGISRLKKGEKTFQTYFYDVNDTNTISNTLINCLFEDSKKRLWIGTFEGLCRYNPQTDNFIRYHPDFASHNICAIEEGNDGNLWISNLNGISEFNPETGEVIHNLDVSDGLAEGILSYRASAKSKEGILYFGSHGGVSYFNPEKLVFNNLIPEVLFTGFYLDNQKVIKFGNDEVLPANVSCISQIELEHNQNSIGIEFSSTNYTSVEKNRFKYKLEGVDNDWIETDDGKVTYNYLPPGNYTFTVITANNDDVWNTTGSSIDIIINKPWWLTWWFISIAFGVIFLLIIVIFRLRIAALKAEKVELGKQVQIRTKNLSENNILLKQQNEKIEQQAEKLKEIANNLTGLNQELTLSNATKDKLFSIIAHDLINPFNTILGFSTELIENYDSWDENQKIKFLNYINDSSKMAFNLMQNLLHWARSQKGKIKFNPESLKVSVVFDIVLKEVSYLAVKKEIQIISLLKDKNLTVFFDSDMITLIIRNLLMNAIKFSNPQSKIFINAKEIDQNSILFSVKDQGVGMKAEYAASIFNSEENFNISEGTTGEKGVGLGLSLCKEFITSQKENIWVDSSPGKGSTFFFTLPKNNNIVAGN